MYLLNIDVHDLEQQIEDEAQREECNDCEQMFKEGLEASIPPSEMRKQEQEPITF